MMNINQTVNIKGKTLINKKKKSKRIVSGGSFSDSYKKISFSIKKIIIFYFYIVGFLFNFYFNLFIIIYFNYNNFYSKIRLSNKNIILEKIYSLCVNNSNFFFNCINFFIFIFKDIFLLNIFFFLNLRFSQFVKLFFNSITIFQYGFYFLILSLLFLFIFFFIYVRFDILRFPIDIISKSLLFFNTNKLYFLFSFFNVNNIFLVFVLLIVTISSVLIDLILYYDSLDDNKIDKDFINIIYLFIYSLLFKTNKMFLEETILINFCLINYEPSILKLLGISNYVKKNLFDLRVNMQLIVLLWILLIRQFIHFSLLKLNNFKLKKKLSSNISKINIRNNINEICSYKKKKYRKLNKIIFYFINFIAIIIVCLKLIIKFDLILKINNIFNLNIYNWINKTSIDKFIDFFNITLNSIKKIINLNIICSFIFIIFFVSLITILYVYILLLFNNKKVIMVINSIFINIFNMYYLFDLITLRYNLDKNNIFYFFLKRILINRLINTVYVLEDKIIKNTKVLLKEIFNENFLLSSLLLLIFYCSFIELNIYNIVFWLYISFGNIYINLLLEIFHF